MLTPQTIVDLDRGIRALRDALHFHDSVRASSGVWIRWHSVFALPGLTNTTAHDAKVAA